MVKDHASQAGTFVNNKRLSKVVHIHVIVLRRGFGFLTLLAFL